MPEKKNAAGEQRSQLFRTVASQKNEFDEHTARYREDMGNISRWAGNAEGTIRSQAGVIRRQAVQIETLSRGLQALTAALGPQAMQRVTAAMSRTADVQNPAQPVFEPPPGPAPFDGVETKTPEAMESPMNPGLVPGSTNDVAADATTTVYQPGNDLPGNALHQLVDVTQPTEGTTGPQPIDTVRTLTDVRVGDPMVPDVAFPLRGPFAEQQSLQGRTSAKDNGSEGGRRAMACMRLVEARAAAGDDEAASNKFELIAAIEKDASRTTADIEREIELRTQIGKTSGKQAPPRGLVPRAASSGGQRAVPSMRSEASYGGTPVGGGEIEDADLFF